MNVDEHRQMNVGAVAFSDFVESQLGCTPKIHSIRYLDRDPFIYCADVGHMNFKRLHRTLNRAYSREWSSKVET